MFIDLRRGNCIMSVARILVAVCYLTIPLFAQPAPAVYRQKMRTFHTEDDFKRTAGSRVKIVRTLDRDRLTTLLQSGATLSSTRLTVIADESPAVTWIGTGEGRCASAAIVAGLAGKRSLPDDVVTGIGFGDGTTWIER